MATLTIRLNACPRCDGTLLQDDSHSPWCERCEWQLDSYENRPDYGWPWNTFARLDHKYGFRLDKAMIGEVVTGKPKTSASEWLLRLVSLVLMLGVAAVAGVGVWLIVAFHNGPAIMGAVVTFAIAYVFRPRFGRLKPKIQGTYRLAPDRYPAFFGMLGRIAEATGTAMPDWVVMDTDWNAWTNVVGLRRQRVLRIGFPLWIALRPQERVALLGHEMGHFANEDSARSLLITPALTYFGRLARTVKPPGGHIVLEGISGLFLLAWRLIGGLLALVLSMVHLGLNVIGARQGRRDELYADHLAAKAGGTSAAVDLVDALCTIGILAPFVNHNPPPGRVARSWREKTEIARDRAAGTLDIRRQLTIRSHASLFASHPAPGRRHQALLKAPYQDAAVVVTEAEAERIDAELSPIAEAIAKEWREHPRYAD